MTPIEIALLGLLFIAVCAWQFATIELANNIPDSFGLFLILMINIFISSALISYHILGWLR
jgi:hypothetical protein